MAAKTTYTATSEYTGETVTRTTARNYDYALDVAIPAIPEYTIPVGTYWITTGHKMHDYNREAGTRGYWQDVKEERVHGGGPGTQGIYSFHGTREAAEKAGRALQAQFRKIASDTELFYGVKVQIPAVEFRLIKTTF